MFKSIPNPAALSSLASENCQAPSLSILTQITPEKSEGISIFP
jgi:hypothetical protein